MSFGDVLLSSEQVRTGPDGGDLSPGAGGWPTVRYFNKETGYDGKPYAKKTDKAMCDELGDNSYMQAYVEEMGGTSLCNAATEAGCGDKEKGYIGKWKDKAAADAKKELTRLSGMDTGAMKPDNAKWLKQRSAILKQFAKDEL